MADPCRTRTRFPAALRPQNTVPAPTAPPSPLPKRCHYCFFLLYLTVNTSLALLISPVRQVKSLFYNQQEGRKQRSGRSLTEESRDESADKKRGIFFSWSRNRSFGKGPKKKDVGDINLGKNLINKRVDFWLQRSPQFKAFTTQTSKVLMCPWTRHQIAASSRVAMSYTRGRPVETQLLRSHQSITHRVLVH